MLLGLLSHCLCKTVPLRVVRGNRDDTRFRVVGVVAQMLVQGEGNGSIYFVILHTIQVLSTLSPAYEGKGAVNVT